MRIGSKAEPLIETWITQDDAALGAQLSEPIDPRMDQGGTDALSLPFRTDGDRPHAVPACGRSIDLNGGERNMAGNLSVFVGDQRYRQGVVSAEPFDDPAG